MRGVERNELSMFSDVSLEDRVPKDHPLRFIRAIVDAALVRMSSKFEALYQDSQTKLRGELLVRWMFTR